MQMWDEMKFKNQTRFARHKRNRKEEDMGAADKMKGIMQKQKKAEKLVKQQ